MHDSGLRTTPKRQIIVEGPKEDGEGGEGLYITLWGTAALGCTVARVGGVIAITDVSMTTGGSNMAQFTTEVLYDVDHPATADLRKYWDEPADPLTE